MSNVKTIDAEMTRLQSSTPCQMCVAVDGGQLECQLLAVDSLACSFETLTIRPTQAKATDISQLKQTADELSRRLSYLLEPISPLETDGELLVIQMRSKPPQNDNGATTYYELVVSHDGVTLCRYSKVVGQPRQRISAQVTREVMSRLANDLAVVIKT